MNIIKRAAVLIGVSASLSIYACAQNSGCEATYLDFSTGLDSNGTPTLYAWTTTTDGAVNGQAQPGCSIGYQMSQGHYNYSHSYSTRVTITPSRAAAVSSSTYSSRQNGPGNGSNTANVQYQDPCFSSDLPGCDGSLYTISGSESTTCSVAGAFYGITLSLPDFELATTKSKTDFSNPETNTVYGTDGGKYCALVDWCTPATSPPACSPNRVLQHPQYPGAPVGCMNYYATTWLAERPAGSSDPWTCFQILPGQNARGLGDPSLGSCKKQ